MPYFPERCHDPGRKTPEHIVSVRTSWNAGDVARASDLFQVDLSLATELTSNISSTGVSAGSISVDLSRRYLSSNTGQFSLKKYDQERKTKEHNVIVYMASKLIYAGTVGIPMHAGTSSCTGTARLEVEIQDWKRDARK